MRMIIAGLICLAVAIGFPIGDWEQIMINHNAMLNYFANNDYLDGLVCLFFVVAIPVGSFIMLGCGVGWLWLYFRMQALQRDEKESKTESFVSILDEFDSALSVDDMLAQIDKRIIKLEDGMIARQRNCKKR